ncbi:hypothetical protein C9374_009144 [Naegleria lovaniensis]|uniref:Transcription initiation factor TFIID subunit 8 n=1 Tax=Naegleria lovaniensis TaxID=51637 RepID=A0AA88GFL2_NAELO|nr:uncharacterized protein C9374_009144 [Naegleria lovaniensis]KAG2377628.1 hypothetical protein C9374_009144 [Naegleria lovaniensis]
MMPQHSALSYNGTSSAPMMTTQRSQNGRGMNSGMNTNSGVGAGNTSSSSVSSQHQHHDHFAREVLQRVIADACRYHGFHAIKSSASDFLIDLMQSLIQNIASSSVEYSTHCGRTEVNVFDVERALKHRMNIGVNDLLSFMNVLQDKSQDDSVDLATFEFDIPDIPKATSSSLMSCPQTHFHLLYKNKGKTIMFDEEEEEEHERQIQLIEQQKPKFLPSLPPKHTFRFTPIMNKRTRDQYKIQLEKTRQRRHIEESLTRLHEAELIQVHDYLEQQQKELQHVDHAIIPHDQTALIKTKKKTIVQKNDVLLHLDKKPASLAGQRKKKPEDEQAMPNQAEEEEGEMEDITQDETATTVVNPYLQIEKQRVSLAVQRNVTQSTTNPINVSRLTSILSTPKKSHTTKKPFISMITRDDSAEVQASKLLKSGAIANQLASTSNDEDLDISSEVIPTKQKKSLGVIEPASIRASTNDSSLMPPPSNPISQFAPSQMNLSSSTTNPTSSAGNSFQLSSSFGTIEPISQPPSSTSVPSSSDIGNSSSSTNNVANSGDDDEFEEVEAGEPNSKKFKF